MAKAKVSDTGVLFGVRVLMSKETVEFFRGERSKAQDVAAKQLVPINTIRLPDILRLELAIHFADYFTNGRLTEVYDKHHDAYWSQALYLTEAEYAPINKLITDAGENETVTIARFFKQVVHDRQWQVKVKQLQEAKLLHEWLKANLTVREVHKLGMIYASISDFIDLFLPHHPIHKSPLIYWLGNTRTAITKVMAGEVPDER